MTISTATGSTAPGLSEGSRRALDEFLALPGEEYVEVWKTLPAPAFGEMDGEYVPQFPPNFNEVHKELVGARLFDETSPTGCWLGKAYTPLGPVSGEGYNIWRMADGREQRRVRFGTHLGAGRVDGGLSLVMTYASFNRGSDGGGFGVAWESDMIDEMRKLADGVFIGCGTHRADGLLRPGRGMMVPVYESYGFTLADSYELHERTPALPAIFVLTGPVRPYVGVDDPAAEDR